MMCTVKPTRASAVTIWKRLVSCPLPDLPKVFNKPDLMFLASLLKETECSGPTENDK